ncbi:MAG: hypothetical protein F4Z35_09375 [Dehalococcoidia bacterium]|nr:hypothetical protein [Dehalococcoidia bacterium]
MLTQDEAERLIGMEKRFEDAVDFLLLPEPGQNLTFPLASLDGQESFLLDVRHGQLEESSPNKWRLQLRYGDEVLVRIETGGPAHRNADDAPTRRLSRYAGQRIQTPHIQMYIEGQDRPWAFPPPDEFTALDDIVVTWREFLDYCGVIETPTPIGGV